MSPWLWGITAVSTVQMLIYGLYYWRRRRDVNVNEDDDLISFHGVFSLCHPSTCNALLGRDYGQCSRLKLRMLLDRMEASKSTLVLCLYQLDLSNVFETILSCHRRGVQVRLITHTEKLEKAVKILNLKEQGVAVKGNGDPEHLMHHKFIIIDGSVLLSGSFNWSSNSRDGNAEFVLITSKTDIVQKFAHEFDRLWEVFS